MQLTARHDLHGRMQACIIGSALGDALGGPVEGLHFSEIIKQYGVVDRMLPYPASLPPSFHGPFGTRAGDYTDDTRLSKLICTGIIRSGGLPKSGDIHRVIGEAFHSTESVLERGFLEEYALKAFYGQEKEAFGGKATNGAIMAIAPVGLLFPGDPHRTFDSAFNILSMATGSARISAAAAAACISVALTGKGTVLDIVIQGLEAAEECIHRTEASFWHYGRMYPRVGAWVTGLSRKAIAIASEFGDSLDVEFRKRLYDEISQPFFADGDETLAIALAMFVAAKGDFRASVIGAVNYGKDCDSYAAVAGALAGAYNGLAALPDDWVELVEACEEPPELRHLSDGLCARVCARMRRELRSSSSIPFPGRPAVSAIPIPGPVPSGKVELGSGLVAAVSAKDADTVLGLLEAGTDPDERGKLGRTGLHLACAAGSIDIVKTLLIFGADIDAKDDNLTTALHFAAWENHVEIVDLILDWGIFPEETEGSGWTALHDSVRKEYADIPIHILSKTRGLRGGTEKIGMLETLSGEDRFLALLGILAEYHVNLGAIGICGHGLLHDAKQRTYLRAVDYLLGKGVPDEA